MYNSQSYELGNKSSIIREIFEYGKTRAAQIGADKVFDFSLGNPSVAPPKEVNAALLELINTCSPTELHGYTSAAGALNVRKAIAESINSRFSTNLTFANVYMTAGAAASLTITINALCEEGDRFIAFAPFFPEYRVFTEGAGATLDTVKPDERLQPDLADLEAKLNKNTKAVIINSPNNPSGVVYTERTITAICELLRKKSREYGKRIFIICDEPYRELVYGGANVPYLMNYYDDVFVCYSFSKSLSLPGERIGYIALSDKMKDAAELFKCVCGAGRRLGYVCAPSLFQQVAARCLGVTGDIAEYERNRNLLYDSLTEYGFDCVKPEGAFYLFVKAPNGNAYSFYEAAKRYELLIVPADSFGVEGYARISYCVAYETIKNSLPAFKKLADELIK